MVNIMKILSTTSLDLEGWIDIESQSVHPFSLRTVFWNGMRDRPQSLKDNLILKNAIKFWDHWRQRLVPHFSSLMPLSSTLSGCPPLPTSILLQLNAANVYSVQDLIHNGKLIDKRELEDRLQTSRPWYIYICGVTLSSIVNRSQKRPGGCRWTLKNCYTVLQGAHHIFYL